MWISRSCRALALAGVVSCRFGGVPAGVGTTDDGLAGSVAPLDAGPSAGKVVWRSGTSASDLGDPCVGPELGDRRREVCRLWACAQASSEPAEWAGASMSCRAGSVNEAARTRALAIVNAYRRIAGAPPVMLERTWEDRAQSCALLAHANAKLDHHPPASWKCWSKSGAVGSSASLIANRSAPPAIDAFMQDPANETTMSHRRWLLDEHLERIAFGSTDRYSCAAVAAYRLDDEGDEDHVGDGHGGEATDDGAEASGPRGWVAWPSDGAFPFDAFGAHRLDEIGWTIQADVVLDDATVVVEENGERMAVDVATLEPWQGSRAAVRFVPRGWSTREGARYEVRLTAKRLAAPIVLTIEPIRCP